MEEKGEDRGGREGSGGGGGGPFLSPRHIPTGMDARPPQTTGHPRGRAFDLA